MQLKLYIQQTQLKDKLNNDRYIELLQSKLTYTNGVLPQARRLSCYNNYTEITKHVSDLHKLKLTWTQERRADGLASPGATSQKKAASGTLTFEGDAYYQLKSWLIDDESALLNTIDVKIQDSCGNYTGWQIKAVDITWCEDSTCIFDVGMKQTDEPLTCIKNTWIADDWQGWFGNSNTPQSGKRHPRFSYCNEIRPNGILITLWWTITQLMSVLGPMMLAIAPVVNSIVWTLKTIIYPVINTILGVLGKEKLDADKLNYIDYKDVKDIAGNFFLESGGCGREHPAPLIRDYIKNVCDKCGVKVDEDSAPIFFAQHILMETSADRREKTVAQWRSNPHYNACYFYGIIDKGIRRFDDLNIFSGAVKNTTDWWIPGNAPLLTLDAFLDSLKTVYNSEWRIENNTLYFKRKDYWLLNNPVFDFSGANRQQLTTGICYEWDEVKSPVYAKGLYSSDAADVCGNNACNQMNGYASFGDIDTHPMLDGVMDKTTMFGATKFRLDGASTDYLFDAMQQVINTTLITGSIWTTPLFSSVNAFFRDYANYALLLKQETATLPKILIWDGQSFDNAKCVKPYHATRSTGGAAPNPNKQYNTVETWWEHRHQPQTKVSGRKLVPPAEPHGAYEVKGLFGALVTRQAAQLVNYPMYFEPGYDGSLWDWFHWIDDLNLNPRRYQRFKVKMDLCCDTLNNIQPFANGNNIILGQKIKLPLPYLNEGRVTEIEISYDPTEDTGPYIQLKGTV